MCFVCIGVQVFMSLYLQYLKTCTRNCRSKKYTSRMRVLPNRLFLCRCFPCCSYQNICHLMLFRPLCVVLFTALLYELVCCPGLEKPRFFRKSFKVFLKLLLSFITNDTGHIVPTQEEHPIHQSLCHIIFYKL